MPLLPSASSLIQRCRALATLDLILSPEWEYRCYSFNSHWSDAELMASMRDGCGNEWWLVFHEAGWAALKGLNHECPAWSRHGEKLSTALQQAVPTSLTGFTTEPAFRWNETSFAYFQETASGIWARANDLTPYGAEDAGEADLLPHLVGKAADYACFARDYYETDVDEHLVAQIFNLQPITPDLVKALNPSTTWEEISEELCSEIQYPENHTA
jgi:hypothetical protein